MILWDWFTHILYAFGFTQFFLYKYFRIIVLYFGYNNFWITYWGIGLLLAYAIYLEKPKSVTTKIK